jgi:tetratricopeptide (TPR) repeat protein
LVELFPDRLDYRPELADLLADHDDADSALRVLRVGLAQGDNGRIKGLARGTAPHERPSALPYADVVFTTGWYLALNEDWELAAHHYLSAEDVYESLGRPRERSDALNNAGVAMVEVGRPLAAAASLRSALELRSAQDSPTRVATSGYNLGRALADAGRLGRALSAYKDAARVYREVGAEREARETLVERLALLARAGQVEAFAQAGAKLVEELEAESPDDVEFLAAVWFEIGKGRYSFGEQEAALSAYERSLSLWRQQGSRLEEGQALYSISLPHVALMRFAKAHQTLVEALLIAVELGDSSSILAIRMQLSELGVLMRTRGDEIPEIPEELKRWTTPEDDGGP